MAAVTCAVLMYPTALGQIIVNVVGAGFALLMFKSDQIVVHDPLPLKVRRRTGEVVLALFFVLLSGLPILAELAPSQTIALIDSFYRAGSLVFGGGHVVMPLLQAEVVPSSWITNQTFLAGYGAAQAVPVPLIHLCGLSWCVDEKFALRHTRLSDLSARDFHTFISAGCRGIAVLGAITP